MFLSKKRLASSRFYSPIFNAKNENKGLSDAEIKEIVAEFKVGNFEKLDYLVKSYMRLLQHIAGQYVGAFFNFKDDIASVSVLAFIQGCKDIDKLKDDNLIGYLLNKVHSDISIYIGQVSVIGPKRGSVHHFNKLNITRPTIRDIDDVAIKDLLVDRKANHVKFCELKELVNDSILSREERIIMDYKMQGYTLEEIASMMRRSRGNVARIIETVKDRLCEKLNT
jgi:RNA polymerase sigma factor (sigma-70 family)